MKCKSVGQNFPENPDLQEKPASGDYKTPSQEQQILHDRLQRVWSTATAPPGSPYFRIKVLIDEKGFREKIKQPR
jgi:hypothetical protein